MTSLIDKIEMLIKREKTTPDRKKDDTTKSSSEILSELFSAFNADPPKIDDIAFKKAKKSKKKHKKEKKKRSRSASVSSDSDYSRKRKKRKKSKSKKRKEDRSPSRRYSKSPISKRELKVKIKNELDKINQEAPVKVKEELKIKTEPVKTEVIKDDTNDSCIVLDDDIDASEIPMPESPIDKLKSDLRSKLDKKQESVTDNDKTKSKIQIKNLKFSTVFEETVKKAEEEAKKKKEKLEEGEYTDSSSSSDGDEVSNSQFPKSSDLVGILRQQAAEETKLIEEQKTVNRVKTTEKSHKTSQRDRSRSRKRSTSRKRSKSRSTSRHRRRHRSRSKSHHRTRSRSRRSHSRHRSRSRRSRSRHRSTSRSRHRSSSKSRHRSRHSSRHRRRSRSPTGVRLADSEKKRLLEVARRNAINMLKNGAVPAGAAALPPHTRNQVMAAIQSGGKSVDELTDFCKHLSKKEALGELSSVSSNDEDMSENEDTIAFHHPFLVKEKAPIIMNIRGGAPLPTKTSIPVANKDELRLQFPVSSGTQHREKADTTDNEDMQLAVINTKPSSPLAKTLEPIALPGPKPDYLKVFTGGNSLSTVPALPAATSTIDKAKDVASIVSEKLSLIRKEQENYEVAPTHGFGFKSSSLGQFTGSTGAHILTPRELASGAQAWAKKDQLVRAAPVEGGMGMHLLQKMGWTPGRGLGKEGTGALQPLLLEVKLDTRGLTSKEEVKPQRIGRRGPAPLVAGGKHPVSLLGEYCSKQKLGPPEYSLCFECGPDHKKNFLFKVKVAGIEYQPAVASANKKQAKADAAQLALQKLGIVT
ncbi:protein Son isoform X2 [Danaus plexippus]|uniref:protein Son isoform X2 n=1 Tax=Danaus plexippus TaxID=13037 RepID=UPI002AB0D92A|nr:protein Son isoform X2 [Danaus plexippus]